MKKLIKIFIFVLLISNLQAFATPDNLIYREDLERQGCTFIPFLNYTLVISKDDKRGACKDNVCIKPTYDSIEFTKNSMIVTKNGKKGALYMGQLVVPIEFDDVKGGVSSYFVQKNGKWGAYHNGKLIVPIIYDDVKGTPSKAIVIKDGKKGYYFGAQSKLPAENDEIIFFGTFPYFLAIKNQKYALFYNGDMIFPYEFDKMRFVGQSQRLAVTSAPTHIALTKDNKTALFSLADKEIKMDFKEGLHFCNLITTYKNMIAVVDNKRIYEYNQKKNIKERKFFSYEYNKYVKKYDYVNYITKRFVILGNNNERGFYNLKTKKFECPMGTVKDGYVFNKTTAIIRKTNNTINIYKLDDSELHYQTCDLVISDVNSVNVLNDNFVIITKNGKRGIYSKGELIINPDYDSIEAYSDISFADLKNDDFIKNTKFLVTQNKGKGLIRNKEIIMPPVFNSVTRYDDFSSVVKADGISYLYLGGQMISEDKYKEYTVKKEIGHNLFQVKKDDNYYLARVLNGQWEIIEDGGKSSHIFSREAWPNLYRIAIGNRSIYLDNSDEKNEIIYKQLNKSNNIKDSNNKYYSKCQNGLYGIAIIDSGELPKEIVKVAYNKVALIKQSKYKFYAKHGDNEFLITKDGEFHKLDGNTDIIKTILEEKDLEEQQELNKDIQQQMNIKEETQLDLYKK